MVRELTLLGAVGADRDDAVLVRALPEPGWLPSLEHLGQPAPRLLRHPAIDPASRFVPFGWSAEAAELNAAHDTPAPHSALACVRRVNGRTYALELERRLFPADAPGAVEVRSVGEVAAALQGGPAAGVVVKSEHGNAGIGNRRLRGPRLGAADRAAVVDLLAEDDGAVVEPWLERTRDWSVAFDVPFDEASCRVYETLLTADGAPLGVYHDPPGAPDAPEPALRDAARRVAAALAADGYHGPVCVDAFEWRDGERGGLRRLADLNARLPVSAGPIRLVRRALADRCVLFRFFARARLRLPERRDELAAALGASAYDDARRRGVAVVSPLAVRDGDESWRPARAAALIVGRDRGEVGRLERDVRERLER